MTWVEGRWASRPPDTQRENERARIAIPMERLDLLRTIERDLPRDALELVAFHHENQLFQERFPNDLDVREGRIRPGDYVGWHELGCFCFPSKVYAVGETDEEGNETRKVYHLVSLVQSLGRRNPRDVKNWSNFVCCPANGVDQAKVCAIRRCHEHTETFLDMDPKDIVSALDEAMRCIFSTDYGR